MADRVDAVREALALMDAQVARAFPGALAEHFARVCHDLAQAAPPGAVLAYARHAPAAVPFVGADAVLAMAGAVGEVARAAGRHAAIAFAAAAPAAARVTRDAPSFAGWVGAIALLAPSGAAPVVAVLKRSESLLEDLGATGFARWIQEGLRATEAAPERRAAFFALEGDAGRGARARAAGEIGFAELDRQLGLFATMLWGEIPLLQAAPPDADGRQRRASFAGTVIRLPPAFRGVAARDAANLYRAAVAHVMAHLRFGGARFPLGGLKPLQVALVSLIEDARVEHLARRELPGLGRLWLPHHVARRDGALGAASLLARLARALIDPAYDDGNPWVEKGRRLFAEAAAAWHDPAISRQLGNLLGNDLGQMRVQFNPRTHVVEPLYRDDNLGLWDFGDDGASDADAAALPRPARLESDAHRPPSPDAREAAGETDRIQTDRIQTGRIQTGRVRAVALDAAIGIPVARYPEWDHLIRAARHEWTTLVEYAPPIGDALALQARLGRRQALMERIAALIRGARISRPVRLRRQAEGEQIDLDAALAAAIERRAGLAPDPRVYARTERHSRDLAVVLLLDASRSTNDLVPGSGRRVLDLEVEAAALFGRALQRVGDPFAISAFCSNRRGDVRYFRIKDFSQPYEARTERRLAGLDGRYSTRMGAALRHAGAELALRDAYRRLLLIITDGEPSDIDIVDRRYLVEDARRAVQDLARAGTDIFCIGLAGRGESDLARIFGPRNVLHVDRLETLPESLAKVYFRLTGT